MKYCTFHVYILLFINYFTDIYRDNSTQLVDSVGLIMFAVYQVVVAIVLVNILIAMMSHSFEAIQVF